ncbi:lateral signaling target protein 2 homolog isoform X2 [Plutella xylostella]|uniref:lateral signaling target protein 2 homolog isoform X2 n=1 Tax=Plutella xylostella TaxID=51655 RepID=UPI0020325058|nr:lateral signaling target protein 2 homolog isoform X2 [Plutella xylostella]
MRLLYKTGPMESLRKWFYKPKRDDRSLLAQFFFADDALNMVAAELDSFDGRKDPERCTTLVNQLRHAQDRVLNITSQIMDQLLGSERVARGFRVKFPEDVLQDNLAGQLWFGAECLAAGSSIMNREEESAAMRPLAKALTRSLETVRSLLREQCLRPRGMALSQHDDMLHESLRIFDRLFAEFELFYVSAMVNVKTPHEFEAQQLICVLFSESLRQALKQGLLTQEQVDSYDPALMFAVPRLAIVSGLLVYSRGPLSIDKPPEEMSDMFRPFRTLLHKIRALLWTLSRRELAALSRLLCSNEDASRVATTTSVEQHSGDDQYPDIGEFVSRFYADHVHCRDVYTSQQSSTDQTISEADYLPDNIEVMTPILDGLRRLSEDDASSDHDTNMSRQVSIETTSTDTFHEQKDYLDTRRKISRGETSDLSSLRNLSTNGLMMFDPLVVSSISNSERQLPDNDLVTSLNEQVTGIADRLSSIAANDVDISDHNMHSFSTNDVPTLISNECAADNYGFSGPRNDQLSCLPSTSHGYLIPNAISQEPVVLASLSHNNSAVFNPEDESENGAIGADLPMIIPDNIDADIVNTNICIANANLSSLLLTNEEYRQSFLTGNEENVDDNTSFHSAMTMDKEEDERVKFMLGYESDHHESPVDSGVSTENTSLDRSPDTDQNKEHFMTQNRVLSPVLDKSDDHDKTENVLENSFSECTDVNSRIDCDVTVNINYVETDGQQKNEAGSSHISVDNVELSKETRDSSARKTPEHENSDVNIEETRRRVLQEWGANASEQEFRTIDEVITELRRHRQADEKLKAEERNEVEQRSSREEGSSSRQKKVRKGSKSKRKRSKMWSPGIVILDNRATMNQNTPLTLNLDHFVDDSGSSIPECADDEQIALALQAQELAARQQARGKFKSSEDLIHRLFVCIAGVADQLQTNFAADLRNILKAVFLMNQTPDAPEPGPEPDREADTIEYEPTEDQVLQNGSSFDSVYSAEEVYADSNSSHSSSKSSDSDKTQRLSRNRQLLEQGQSSGQRRKSVDVVRARERQIQSVSTSDLPHCHTEDGPERMPEWVPDIAAPDCMRCSAHFTAFRRRHHCRNCGKVFCASCSSNSIPLPRYGQLKPVRVCEECFTNIATNCRRTASYR